MTREHLRLRTTLEDIPLTRACQPGYILPAQAANNRMEENYCPRMCSSYNRRERKAKTRNTKVLATSRSLLIPNSKNPKICIQIKKICIIFIKYLFAKSFIHGIRHPITQLTTKILCISKFQIFLSNFLKVFIGTAL